MTAANKTSTYSWRSGYDETLLKCLFELVSKSNTLFNLEYPSRGSVEEKKEYNLTQKRLEADVEQAAATLLNSSNFYNNLTAYTQTNLLHLYECLPTIGCCKYGCEDAWDYFSSQDSIRSLLKVSPNTLSQLLVGTGRPTLNLL